LNESHGRARSAHPGYWPLACGECHLEAFRPAEDETGSRFRLYVDPAGQLWGEVPSGTLERLKGSVVCVACEERRGKTE
jgi:hypothetical protein